MKPFPLTPRSHHSVLFIGCRRFGFTIDERTATTNVYDLDAAIARRIVESLSDLSNAEPAIAGAIEHEFCLTVPATPAIRALVTEIFEVADNGAAEAIQAHISQQIEDEILAAFWTEVNPYLQSPVPQD